MKNNNHGLKNENAIAQQLHNKKYKEITSPNLKQFIKDIHPNITDDTLINCPYTRGIKKEDLTIKIENSTYNVSVKEGSGNSIHQETLESFICTLKKDFNLTESIANDIRMFIWGDGTVDGSGPKKDRMTANQFKQNYPDIVNNIQNYFDKHKRDLLYHFLVTGTMGGNVDYIYYGTPLSGVWCSADSAIEYLCNIKKSPRTAIALGSISFQAWNRCINGSAKEKHRGTIQLKWGSIKKDIGIIRESTIVSNIGTHEGTTGEFDFIRFLNLNKNITNKYWRLLADNLALNGSLENIFAIKVSGKVYSQLTGRKVFPKTDMYLIKASIDKEFMLLNNHLLEEDILKNIAFTKIPGSGISVKRPSSTNYTIQKLSPKLFENIFDNTYLAAGASLYTTKNNLNKNRAIIEGWNSSIDELKQNIENYPDVDIFDESIPFNTRIKACKIIKNTCRYLIENMITSNQKISNIIFKGEGNFEEPYVANFIYENGLLKVNNPVPFLITTGSGRSKGIYSLSIKPR